MKKRILIAPSLLACKPGAEASELAKMEQAGADWLHFDVMDGQFVPNVSFSVHDLERIASFHHMVKDVHIMVANPEDYIEPFASSGADILTFHYEAVPDDDQRLALIKRIHDCGMKAGISIKPQTDASVLEPFIGKCDLFLVMSVEPGFGGQSFLPSALSKIRYLRQAIDAERAHTLIEVDGGIQGVTGPEVVQAGADVLVAGSYLFHQVDIERRIALLRGDEA